MNEGELSERARQETDMDRDDLWIVKNFEHLVEGYAGRYIAVVNEQVVAVGESPKEVDEAARRTYPERIPSVLLVPKEEDFICALRAFRIRSFEA